MPRLVSIGFRTTGHRLRASGGLTAASFLIGLNWAVWTSAAHAQAPAEHIAAARSLGVRGIKLADQGKCEEAIESLERAEALYHAPTILGRLGECQVRIGKVVLGTENLYRVTREALPSDAPPAFRAAQERAHSVLQRALPRIAVLVIRVEPAAASPIVDVDGAPVPAALLGEDRPTDPGTHYVSVSAAGYETQRLKVELAEGGRQELRLELVPSVRESAVPSEPLVPLREPLNDSVKPPRLSRPSRRRGQLEPAARLLVPWNRRCGPLDGRGDGDLGDCSEKWLELCSQGLPAE